MLGLAALGREARMTVAVRTDQGAAEVRALAKAAVTPEQARQLRDQLDQALIRLAGHDRGGPGSIDHMPERNSDDAVDEDGCPTW